MQDIQLLRPKDVRLGREHNDSVTDYVPISTKRARNTIAASVRFRITPWITFIAGRWKFSPLAMKKPSENIRIPLPVLRH